MRAASGRELTGDTVITADNVADYLPSPDDVAAARAAFARAGFATGEPVGIAFSIAAPRSTFERVFGVAVHPAEGGGFVAAAPDGRSGTRELPLAALPDDLARRLVAVTFEPPAELFGPGDVAP
jgi:hypothetical protein